MGTQTFNKYQLQELSLAADHNIPLEKLYNSALPVTTMHEIRKGLEHGVDITQYSIDQLNFSQVREIRHALEDKLDVNILLSKSFTSFQMHELALGLKAHIDVMPYADIALDYRQMASIRHEAIDTKLKNRECWYSINMDTAKKCSIYVLENGEITKATKLKFDTYPEAQTHLDKLLSVDNFYKAQIHHVTGLNNLIEIQTAQSVKANLTTSYSNLKINGGYYILDENKGFALGFNPSAPDKYVLWHNDGRSGYSGGHYYSEFCDALVIACGEKSISALKVADMLKNIGALSENTMENTNEMEM